MPDLKQELASLRIHHDRPAPRRWRWVLLLCVLVIAAAGVFYILRAHPVLWVSEVETVRPTIQSFDSATAGTPLLSASGYVVARRKAVVSAKIQGRLAELKVEEGSRVREGQIIARLESDDYRAQVERARADVQRAQADLEEARRQLRITEGLAREKVFSQDQLDAARSKVNIAEAALAQAQTGVRLQQEFYENTIIRAPFAGVVVKKMAEVGESVAPITPGVNISTSSGAIVALADMATLEVEVDVGEANVAKLNPQQPAEVVVQALPNRKFRGALRQVIPTADRTKATVQAKITILDKDKDLKPEMSANVTFLETAKKGVAISSAPLMTVPKEAVVTRAGKQIVFAVENGKAREHTILTGAELQGNLVVKQGLGGAEALVVSPPDGLHDGDNVRVKE